VGYIVAGVVGLIVVLVVAAVAIVAVSGSGDNSSVAEPSTTGSGPVSTTSGPDRTAEENAVEAAAEKRVDLINDEDAYGLHDMACAADARTESIAGYQDLFENNGSITARIDVRDVRVNGAVGTVDGVMTIESEVGDVHWAFRNEDSEWRFCPSLVQRSPGDEPEGGGIITG
jgi:hypothetical protein